MPYSLRKSTTVQHVGIAWRQRPKLGPGDAYRYMYRPLNSARIQGKGAPRTVRIGHGGWRSVPGEDNERVENWCYRFVKTVMTRRSREDGRVEDARSRLGKVVERKQRNEREEEREESVGGLIKCWFRENGGRVLAGEVGGASASTVESRGERDGVRSIPRGEGKGRHFHQIDNPRPQLCPFHSVRPPGNSFSHRVGLINVPYDAQERSLPRFQSRRFTTKWCSAATAIAPTTSTAQYCCPWVEYASVYAAQDGDSTVELHADAPVVQRHASMCRTHTSRSSLLSLLQPPLSTGGYFT